MNINKKYIIILGTLLLSLVVITGAITYYNEKKEGSVYDPIPMPEEKEYLIWCYDNDIRYDCSNRESFRPGESVAIAVNLIQFNNIPYDSYFLCYRSDLKGESEKQCLPRSASSLAGFTLEDGMIFADKDNFTLLKLSVYPDDSFNNTDEIVIMDLAGRLIK